MARRTQLVLRGLAPTEGASADEVRHALDEVQRATTGLGYYALLPDALDIDTASTTTAYVLGDDAFLAVNTSGGGVAVTLPLAASVPGRMYTVKKTTTDVNPVTLGRSGADLIDGATTHAFGAAGSRDARTVVSDGVSNWWVI